MVERARSPASFLLSSTLCVVVVLVCELHSKHQVIVDAVIEETCLSQSVAACKMQLLQDASRR